MSESASSIKHAFKASKDSEIDLFPRKRQKQSSRPGAIHSTDAFCNQVRTAFDIKRAVKAVCGAIGYSVSKFEKVRPPTPEQREVLKQLRSIAKDFPKSYKFGTFEDPFHLSITRPGCEFTGNISLNSSSIEELLPHWFEKADISGYGDMETLQTKIDSAVRSAKEIPATEFTIDCQLIERIRKIWADNFIPSTVRVEPYKIHLYGPQGRFRAHRDTPETGLVGTFLVGLGDTSVSEDSGGMEGSDDMEGSEDLDGSEYSEHGSTQGNFRIGNACLAAKSGTWTAFYPDIPHSVSELHDGHRAVIAFKIFYDASVTTTAQQESVQNLEIMERMKTVLTSIPTPYGILLEHLYHIGISQLNGFDALLLSAARRSGQAEVHILPVVIRSRSEVHYNVEDPDPDDIPIPNLVVSNRMPWDDHDDVQTNEYETSVYPLTPAHVDSFLSPHINSDAEEKIKWWKDITDIPFYSRNFNKSTSCWERDTEYIDYTGNEADGEIETCVYLSHALLVLSGTD